MCKCNTCKVFSFPSLIDKMDHCFCLIILTILIAEHPGVISVFCTFSINNLLPSTVWTVVQCPAILTALIRCLVHETFSRYFVRTLYRIAPVEPHLSTESSSLFFAPICVTKRAPVVVEIYFRSARSSRRISTRNTIIDT